MKVSFIGLGIMGQRMAANLLKNGVALTMFNRSAGPMERLADLGAITSDSPSDAVAEADFVFTMLPSPEVIEPLAMGEGGFLSAMNKGAMWIDCSTVNPSFSKKSGDQATLLGLDFLDAPVAGTKPNAEQGNLVFFIGGREEHVSRATPLLELMGSKIIHVGPMGSGSSFKMLVNNMLALSMAAFAETLALGESLGLGRDFLLDTLPNLPVSAPFLKNKAELIRKDNFDAQFPLEWMHKDLQLVSQTAYETGIPMFLAGLGKELYGQANQKGLGREDFAAIFKHMND